MDLTLPLDYAAIEGILQHRYPFLFVDRITEFEVDKRIVGIKNVSLNERYLSHSASGSPVLPPTILTEVVAQVGAILILAKPENRQRLPFFAGIERVRYRRPVLRRRCAGNRSDRAAAAQQDGTPERHRPGRRKNRDRRHDDLCAGTGSKRAGRGPKVGGLTATRRIRAITPAVHAGEDLKKWPDPEHARVNRTVRSTKVWRTGASAVIMKPVCQSHPGRLRLLHDPRHQQAAARRPW